jgi:phosphatidyl-myo-inositol dimannoside synthase
MKFLLITLEYFPFKGGIANYYTNLSYYWPKNSELFVLNNNKGDLLSSGGFFRWRKSLFRLYHFIKKNKIKHIIVGHILPLGISAFVLNKILKTEYSVVLHGMDFSLATRNPWKRFLSKIILKNASKILVANSYTADLCSKFLKSSDKIKVVNPGIKDSVSVDQESVEDSRKRNNLEGFHLLFSIGRLVERKGFDYTIMALNNIYKQNPEAKVVYIIAGKGPDEEYLKKVAQSSLGDNWEDKVKFIGEIDEKEKWSLFCLCDIFVMPSRNISGDFEGFGIVYLEANLSKKAVIAGRSGGVPDAVVNGLNGILVNPENYLEISEAISTLLENDSLRLEMGEKGRERALKDFNWQKQVREIYNFLNL